MPRQNPPSDDRDPGLRRVLGRISTTNIVIGAIVGVGIFFTPTNVARIAGDSHLALWTWVAGGLALEEAHEVRGGPSGPTGVVPFDQQLVALGR